MKTWLTRSSKWIGDVKIIYGRPRHSQSQGLVEQSNGSEMMMYVMMAVSKLSDVSAIV